MNGRPVTIRLLDPPLHEFLPQDDVVRRQLAEKLGVPFDFVIDRIKALHEENPMLDAAAADWDSLSRNY